MDFSGQHLVVLDSAAVIGPSCSDSVVDRGGKVLCNTRRAEGGLLVTPFNQVITSYHDTKVAAERAISEFGQVDGLLFVTPSYRNDAPCSIEKEDSWDLMQSSDLDGAFRCIKVLWPMFRKQGHGRIVFVSAPEKDHIATSASRFAIFGLAQTLAREGAKYNITANVIMIQSPLYVTGNVTAALQQACIAPAAALATKLLNLSSKEHSGGLFQVGQSGVSKLRWERSRGIFLNPDKAFTPGALTRKWEAVTDFSDKTFPDGPAAFEKILERTTTLLPGRDTTDIRFDKQVVIVTGAASGLGRCYAIAFAKLGASVVVNDLSETSKVVNEISSAGGIAVACQASCEDGVKIVNAALQAFGHIDILINNAGFLRDKSFNNMDEAQWKAVLNVHLNGTYQMTRAVWPHFVKQGRGSIVNTSSTSGIYGFFGQANYAAAKLGILGISQATAREGARYGIRVNTIAPVASTAMFAAVIGKDDKNKSVDMKAEYNVPAVLLLSSDKHKGRKNTITGGLFEIGCGWHAATRLRPVSGMVFDNASRITPEDVSRNWCDLSQNVSANVELHKDIEVNRVEYEYSDRDIILYNLSAGAMRNDVSLVYEGSPDFQALPAFGIIPFFSRTVITHHADILEKFEIKKSLLGEHYLEVFQDPIPTSGRFVSSGRVLEVVDKGKAAVVRTGYTTYDASTGHKVFYNEIAFFAGGAGGFGGASKSTVAGPLSQGVKIPSRSPDISIEHQTNTEQAALYRLNGDREAIHIDPAVAKGAGFANPILHGHGTMSIAGKYLFQKYGAFRSIRARFVSPVIPGDRLAVDMWKQDKASVYFRARVVGTGKTCIDSGLVRLLEDANSVTSHL